MKWHQARHEHKINPVSSKWKSFSAIKRHLKWMKKHPSMGKSLRLIFIHMHTYPWISTDLKKIEEKSIQARNLLYIFSHIAVATISSFLAIFSFKILLSSFHSPFLLLPSDVVSFSGYRQTAKKNNRKWKLFRNLKLNWLKKFPTQTLSVHLIELKLEGSCWLKSNSVCYEIQALTSVQAA